MEQVMSAQASWSFHPFCIWALYLYILYMHILTGANMKTEAEIT